MDTNDSPNNPQDIPAPDSDRTLDTGDVGGPAAGQIGPYRLLQVLGEGGMGEVWLAEQKAPIHRTVALKLIKAGMDTKSVVARFESERQALALMDHPNIAQVYDAGSTPEGRPYFVMEYAPGVPITEYCDRHRLTMRQRLELFTQVCDGVHHAHQKAVIHRDLKPSNVLVVEQGNKAVPKIIDFGLVKAMGPRLTDKTMFTEIGVLVGTPEYMSPEQADLREQNIDTRTDVYSLGVILYELLVGALPFDTRALRAAGLEAILRVIREVDPPRPSTKVRSMGVGSTATAENRREEPRTFARHLQGELDWITMKALEKDRARRYGTPSDLAADLARHLRNEPVVAGPATTGYRIKKYAARHRLALGTAAVFVLLLAGFAAAQAVEIRRIRLERDRANRERDRANRVTDFMTGMFKVSDPSEAKGNSVTAREILDKASDSVETGLAKDPELQAKLMDDIGVVYSDLGLYARAEALLERALEIRRRFFGPEHPDTIDSMIGLSNLLNEEGRYAESEKLCREALAVVRRVFGPEKPETASVMTNLAIALSQQGQYSEAAKLDQETLAIRQKTIGPENPGTLETMLNLAADFHAEGRLDEAEKLEREALEIGRRALGESHPDTIAAMNNLVNILAEKNQFSEAEKLQREVVENERRVLGPEHPRTLIARRNLANVLQAAHQYGEAEQLLRETLETQKRVLGPEDPGTLRTISALGFVLTEENRFADAEKLDREVLEVQRSRLGPNSADAATSVYNLGCLEARRGHRDEALNLVREAVDHGYPPDDDLRIEKDSDLESLRGDPRFAALVAHAKDVAAAAQKPK